MRRCLACNYENCHIGKAACDCDCHNERESMGNKPRNKPEEAPETHRVLMLTDQMSDRRIGVPETYSEAIATAKEWAQEMIGCSPVIEVVKIVGVAEVQTEVVYSGDE